MTIEEQAIRWARYFMQERRAGNPNAQNRANARVVLDQMNEAARAQK